MTFFTFFFGRLFQINYLILFRADPSGEDENHYATFIETAGGLDKIELLQSHPQEKIYELAFQIVTEYYPDEFVSGVFSSFRFHHSEPCCLLVQGPTSA